MSPEIKSAEFVTSDGVRLHVLEACPQGAAIRRSPVIAFVPGWSMPAAIWRGQMLELGAAHCVAALDPRGQGTSEVSSSGYTIGRRAEDLHEFVSRYSRVVLVAWSLAALEALEYVDRHGHAALDGLVLVDSTVGEDPETPSGTGFVDALRRDRRATMEDFVQGIFRSPRPAPEIAALTDAALRMPLEASLSLFPRAIPRERWRAIVTNFPKPLLYVVSARFADQAQSLLQHRPATRVAIFEEAGHALFVDEADRFNAVLGQFVTEAAGWAIAPRRE